MSRAFVIALLGAESTGKTTLAAELQHALEANGSRVALVSEYLRTFYETLGRNPRVDEQRAIAAEQTLHIERAAREHDIVVADTSALMIAVYSDYVFGDASLYASALADHARCDLTLLTALDLPWRADGPREGAHVREPVDARIRAALARSGVPYAVVSGFGAARLQAALACVQRALNPPQTQDARTRWHWGCERCGDGDCERHLLPRMA